MLILTEGAVYSADESAPQPEPVRVLDEGAVAVEASQKVGVAALADGDIAVIGPDGVDRQPGGVEDEIHCLNVLRVDPLTVLIGAEPAHLYLLEDGGPALRVESFDQLEVRDDWYTPWGGPPAVRSLARTGEDVYADIHVGSIVRSADGGKSWEPVAPGLHPDVHQVAVCPAAPGRVYANTADAVFLSDDRGETWHHRASGLPTRYGRAIAVHPEDPDCLLASVSRGPRAEGTGQLFRSGDAGRSWEQAGDCFPAATTDNVDTFHVAFDAGGTAWASVEERLYRSEDRGRGWSVAWQAPAAILALSCPGPSEPGS